ncbi:ABC transporter permease [Yunchengibacter salinarum]|uniref:ABC transporter permease n=1 Tax=Yunchengibacter salinarum TaxID=3133399 RepID=UPI0035B5C6A5
MKERSALGIQRDVIFAVFLREMNSRFSGYTFGNIWILLEPIMMAVVFVLLFGLRGRGEFGFTEPAVFILVGVLSHRRLWNVTMKESMGAMRGSGGLTQFRQVRLFDIFLARWLLEAVIFLVVSALMVAGFAWFGMDAVPADPLLVLLYATVTWFFAGFFGLLMGILAFFAREIEKVINLTQMPLLFLSAVFYPMTIIPEPYRTWLAWNPLVHVNELIREAWLKLYVSPVADLGYLMDWTVLSMVFAMAAYRLRWRRMVAT